MSDRQNDVLAGFLRDRLGDDSETISRATQDDYGPAGYERFRANLRSKVALLKDITAEKHRVVDEDQYYTCPAATEERDGGTYAETEGGGRCSCGLVERVNWRLRWMARPYAGHPDYNHEWSPR